MAVFSQISLHAESQPFLLVTLIFSGCEVYKLIFAEFGGCWMKKVMAHSNIEGVKN